MRMKTSFFLDVHVHLKKTFSIFLDSEVWNGPNDLS